MIINLKRLLSCHFPFVFNKQHHNECQVSGVNNELCLCGTDAARPNIDEFYMEIQSQDFIFDTGFMMKHDETFIDILRNEHIESSSFCRKLS